ncbi:helix-turn-helix transcriptional regulator [Thiolinea disciformis]|uniref:helix-turn-helix transcriptional regulator n=1 Tax=Thiolinea disciformis TaxID=125614 RepID=UPI00039E5B5C|nr:helix-turn-helix domain-containing protein [Thiolinea disciformis]
MKVLKETFLNWDDAKRQLKKRKEQLSKPVEWLTREDICQRYRISRSTTYRLQREGKLPTPSYHFGKNSPRWDVAELAELIHATQEEGKHDSQK